MLSDMDFVTGPIEVVGCHAEGEVGDVIIGNEPSGGVFKHVNLLVPAIDPAADIGFISMEPMDTPLMSGSNAMCVATVVLGTGIVPMTEPTTTLTLEAPAGLVRVEATCTDVEPQNGAELARMGSLITRAANSQLQLQFEHPTID